jgi:hypothetical protein
MTLPKYLKASSITLVAITILTAALSGIMLSPSQAQSFSGTLVPTAGLVQILPRGSDAWVNVGEKRLVQEGDQIRTGSDGVAHLNIVTGIAVDIYPTSEVILNNLSMRDDSGEVFNLVQIVGTTYTNVTQTVRASDEVQITLPTAGVTVHGTQFFTYVDPDLNVGVISQEHSVEVQTADNRKFTVTPDNFIYIQFKISPSTTVTLTCTPEILRANTIPHYVIEPLNGDTSKIQALRNFLRSLVRSNLNPHLRVFLRSFVGLPAVQLDSLGVNDDEEELQETLNAIDTLSPEKVSLSDFLSQYRDFWSKTYKGALTDPMSPATCGNGKADAGEAAANCPDDFSNPASCGNGMCETNRPGLGESAISCPADCLPHEKLALSCSLVIRQRVHPPTPTPGGAPSGVGR